MDLDIKPQSSCFKDYFLTGVLILWLCSAQQLFAGASTEARMSQLNYAVQGASFIEQGISTINASETPCTGGAGAAAAAGGEQTASGSEANTTVSSAEVDPEMTKTFEEMSERSDEIIASKEASEQSRKSSGGDYNCITGTLMVGLGVAALGAAVQTGDAACAMEQGCGKGKGADLIIPEYDASTGEGGESEKGQFSGLNIKEVEAYGKKALETMQNNGIQISADGKSVSAGDQSYSSAALLGSAGGMSTIDSATAQKALASLDKQAPSAGGPSVEGMGFEGGGGSGGRSRSYGAGKKYVFEDPFKKIKPKKVDVSKIDAPQRELASGEVIGAQNDNLFEMIHRRYRMLSDKKLFVPNSKGVGK